MEYYKINCDNPDNKVLRKAAEVIKSGGIIAYPTDTLYGLGANIFDEKAMDRLFLLKGRHIGKPISVLINHISQVENITGNLTQFEYSVANSFFPGKITLLLKRKIDNSIPRLNHLKKIGFRIPDNKLTNQLVEYVGSPISTTSANISKKENVKNVEEIISVFGDKIDLILDGGSVKSMKGSSVLDLTTDPPILLRKGDISRSAIVKKLGKDISTNYSGKFTITFICSGNICRSPMGEGILKKVLSRTKFKDIVEVNSAGTLNIPMSPVHLYAAKVSEKYDINLESHISRPLQTKIVREANIIVALALNHYKYLRSHYPEFKNKVILLKQWKFPRNLTNPSVADPIGHHEEFFSDTFKEIQKEIRRVLPSILNQIKTHVRENGIILKG